MERSLVNTHFLCWDSLSMYGLFCHVNVPLMRGQPMASGQDIFVTIIVPPKADNK